MKNTFCQKFENLYAEFLGILADKFPQFCVSTTKNVVYQFFNRLQRILGFNVSRTMSVAQRLYESGRITYMRTDSVSLSMDAMTAIQKQIEKDFGSNFSNPRKFQNKNKSAQEAHEAIRPSNFSVSSIGDGSPEDKLYSLIWKKTMASQMSDAEIERTTIEIGHNKQEQNFNTIGEVIKFEGFLKLYKSANSDNKSDELPDVSQGEIMNCNEISATQKFSRPSARFTEASLVKKLEELGIGRPSTYAPTIKTIQDRGYVENKDIEGKSRSIKQLVLKENVIKERLLEREAGYPVSDARYHHYEDFKKRFEPLNELGDEMHIRVDTEKPLEACMEQILAKDNYIASLNTYPNNFQPKRRKDV